jgi:hypothetical protein
MAGVVEACSPGCVPIGPIGGLLATVDDSLELVDRQARKISFASSVVGVTEWSNEARSRCGQFVSFLEW